MFNGPKCSYRVCTRAKTTSTSIPSLNLSPPLSVLPLLPHRPLSEKSRTPRKVGSFCRRHGPKPDSQYQAWEGEKWEGIRFGLTLTNKKPLKLFRSVGQGAVQHLGERSRGVGLGRDPWGLRVRSCRAESRTCSFPCSASKSVTRAAAELCCGLDRHPQQGRNPGNP